MSNPRAAALLYLDRGWLPLALHTPTANGCTCEDGAECSSIGKHPLRSWPADYRPDRAAIERAWRRTPTPNVGIVTGAVSNLLVLDVDPAHDGSDSLDELRRRYQLADTLTAESGSGGLHLYFTHPGVHIGPSAGKLGPGLDIRADRGLIVAPPSLHASRREYRWLNWGAELAPTPRWLVQALQPKPPKPARPVVIDGNHDAYVKAALTNAADLIRRASDGTKHDVLWRQSFAIGTLVGAGLVTEHEARNVLQNAVAAHGQTLRSIRAAHKTIDASLERGKRCPRQVTK